MVSCMCFPKGPVRFSGELLTEKHGEGIRHTDMLGKFPNCSWSILKSTPINNENVKILLFFKKILSPYPIPHLVGHLDLSASKKMSLSSRFSLVVLDTPAACSFTLLSSPLLNVAHKILTEDISLHLLGFSKSISAIHWQWTTCK